MLRLSTLRNRVRRRGRAALIDTRDVLGAWRTRRALARIRPNSRVGAVAAVVHVYYPEVWPYLAVRLARLDGRDVDVFVTLPAGNRDLIATVHESLPNATCIVVPNRGRDMLPFLLVAKRLAVAGYAAALKVHSKKSLHFGGGDQWRDGMLEELLPADPAVLDAILDALREPGTGTVGPRSTYFPLSTYWAGNADSVRRLVKPAVTPDALARLEDPKELGFFAGTMFWTRLDAVATLLDVETLDFVREPTPKDGTLAHALERAMSVLPELLGRRQFDCDGSDLAPRPASAAPLPEWYRSATKAAIAAERAKRT